METGTPQDRKLTCFVVSPIGADNSETRNAADMVLRHVIHKALDDRFEITRGDHDANPGSITSQIVESILEADLIVADLSGSNPNVYYEVAIAHGYGRPTVHIQRADETPAFDVQDLRLVRYNLSNPDVLEAAQEQLRKSAEFVIQNPSKAKTPLSLAKAFLQIEDSQDPVAQSNLEMIDQFRQLRTEVRRSIKSQPRRIDRGPDIRGMRAVIERAAKRGALDPADFSEIINEQTTRQFDDWARLLLTRITGETETPKLNAVLFEPNVIDFGQGDVAPEDE